MAVRPSAERCPRPHDLRSRGGRNAAVGPGQGVRRSQGSDRGRRVMAPGGSGRLAALWGEKCPKPPTVGRAPGDAGPYLGLVTQVVVQSQPARYTVCSTRNEREG